MESEMSKLLEDVADEMGFAGTAGDHLYSVLKRRLLPLLEAGQAMRDSVSQISARASDGSVLDVKVYFIGGGCVEKWDAAEDNATKKVRP